MGKDVRDCCGFQKAGGGLQGLVAGSWAPGRKNEPDHKDTGGAENECLSVGAVT